MIAHVPLFCMAEAFYSCFLNTPSPLRKACWKDASCSVRHKWDTQPNKWTLLSALWTPLQTFEYAVKRRTLQVLACGNTSLQFSHRFSRHKLWVKTCRSPAFSRAGSRCRLLNIAFGLLFCWVIGFALCPPANPLFSLIQSAGPYAVSFSQAWLLSGCCINQASSQLSHQCSADSLGERETLRQ